MFLSDKFNFTVQCLEKEKTKRGTIKEERFEFLLSFLIGSFSVDLPAIRYHIAHSYTQGHTHKCITPTHTRTHTIRTFRK